VTTRLGGVNVRRSLAAAVIVLAVPLLSSCGVNFGAQTDQVYNPSAGVDDRSGTVDVLNALVVSGKDGSGTLIASLVNNDEIRADTLQGVAGSGSDSSLKVTPGGATTIPAGGLLNLATDGQIFLSGARVQAGNFVKVTLTFGRGKAITVDAPVVAANQSEYAGVQLPPGSTPLTTPSSAGAKVAAQGSKGALKSGPTGDGPPQH
jgi:hypothetical protein